MIRLGSVGRFAEDCCLLWSLVVVDEATCFCLLWAVRREPIKVREVLTVVLVFLFVARAAHVVRPAIEPILAHSCGGEDAHSEQIGVVPNFCWVRRPLHSLDTLRVFVLGRGERGLSLVSGWYSGLGVKGASFLWCHSSGQRRGWFPGWVATRFWTTALE